MLRSFGRKVRISEPAGSLSDNEKMCVGKMVRWAREVGSKWQISFIRSDGGDTVGGFCGAVDGFDEGEAAAALESVADGGAVVLDGLKKIF